MIKLERLTEYSDQALKDINSLMRQLVADQVASGEWQDITKEKLQVALKDSHSHFFVLKDDARIVGTATLILMQRLNSTTAYVEDVVVDETYRGKGLGKRLIQKLIDESKKLGVRKMQFTSKPERIVANIMYQKMGFVLKKTNVYDMKFKRFKW